MNILIVGLGEVGTYLAEVLSTEGHTITVIDPDLQRMRTVADLLDVDPTPYVTGFPADVTTGSFDNDAANQTISVLLGASRAISFSTIRCT